MMDSTGKPIAIGDRVRFRGAIYTIADFGPLWGGAPHAPHAIVLVEPCHTDEIPTEFNVDLVALAGAPLGD